MKIVVLDGYTLNPGDLTWDGFKSFGDIKVYDRTPEDCPDLIKERAGDAEIILINKFPISKHTLASMPNLKYIGVFATGYNVVDIEETRKRNIVVTNIPTYGTAAVAQMTIALLLEICNHVWIHSEDVRKGGWTNNKDFCYWKYPLTELKGKTFGIIGYGRIGQATSKIAQALDMNVLAYSRHRDRTLENNTVKYAELDDLLKKSDVVSLHCPLFDSTRGMINKAAISKMKDGVIIINTSRGPLIVEEDLAEALNSGKVHAAAVDVASKEPIEANNPLLKAKNCIITPHIAWAAKESRQRLMDIAVDNLKKFLNGTPVNAV
ncbi:D-2-hydroxyacid dehydrogenase [Clostridium tyrobutyricum]|uniref:D-2-hydroxyacid dehydrogenase n=1 Tax=Clostridium tyrobutyricum TaxID=1519 RepID=UPI001C38B13B|nr:D-2-hydroxyacid dehydrogenase [Clostridium tyrobutyricum]MBV4431821.1 D-2-hydroxyacid dehydrogenase [Clostridium tyrobutyricum]